MRLDFRQWLNEANYIKLPRPLNLPGSTGRPVPVDIIDMHWEWYDSPYYRSLPLKKWYVALPGRNQYIVKQNNGAIVDVRIVNPQTMNQILQDDQELELGPDPDVWMSHARFFDPSANVVKYSSKEKELGTFDRPVAS